MVDTKNCLFHGAASDLIATFNEDGKINWDLMEKQVEFMIHNHVTGLFVNGLAGEALMMSARERLEIVKVAVRAADNRVPVMSNVIFNSIADAQDYIKQSEELGVDAIIITPPVVYKYSDGALLDHFKIIGSVTGLPLYIYNAPETGNKISPETIAKLFETIDNFWGYKDSTQDIIHQQTVLSMIGKDRHFELLAGSDAQIVTTMMLGGVGVLSLVTSVFPQLVADTCTAAEAGDWARAIELQQKVLRVRQALKIGPFMAAYKFVGELIGSPLGRMKQPLSELTDGEKEKVKTSLSALGMI
jgi:dihydrodipicolinate synthase/N-acetylneuraminate lyase